MSRRGWAERFVIASEKPTFRMKEELIALRWSGVDVKVAQELLRHVNSRTTMDFYTQAISSDKRLTNTRAMELLVPSQSGL
jgi:hypothetical protein